MPYFYGKQPNGMYFRYSTIVDSFTALNMTRAEALAEAIREAGEETGTRKIERADRDERAESYEPKAPEGLRRWTGCVASAMALHDGSAVMTARLLREVAMAEAPPPVETPAPSNPTDVPRRRKVVGYLLKETHSDLEPPCHHYLRCRFSGWEHPRFYFPDDQERRGAFPFTSKEAHRLARGYRKQGRKITVVRLVRP